MDASFYQPYASTCTTNVYGVPFELCLRQRQSLNQADRPFWMMKERYATEFQLRTRNRRPRPPKKVSADSAQPEKASLTTYTWCSETGDSVWYDLGALLKAAGGQGDEVTIAVRTGKKDATKWGSVRRTFGDTRIRVTGLDGASTRTNLDAWDKAEMAARSMVIHATVEQRERVDVKELTAALNDLSSLADALRRADEETLLFYWRVRNVLDRESPYRRK